MRHVDCCLKPPFFAPLTQPMWFCVYDYDSKLAQITSMAYTRVDTFMHKQKVNLKPKPIFLML